MDTDMDWSYEDQGQGARKRMCRRPDDNVNTLSWYTDKNQKEQQVSTSRPLVDQPSAICTDYLEGQCPFESDCYKYHKEKKYQWQIFEPISERWLDLEQDENNKIEEAFSDPAYIHCNFTELAFRVNFDLMEMRKTLQPETVYKIRRLSTPSSCENTEQSDRVHATRWIWYWRKNVDQWTSFSTSQDSSQSGVGSPTIEAEFLQNPEGGVCFETSEHKYRIDFKAMTQNNLNPKYGTERKVRRRPAVDQGAENIECSASKFPSLSSIKSTSSGQAKSEEKPSEEESSKEESSEEEPQVNDRPTSPTICVDNLQDECRNGMSCPRYHCREKYQWQKYDTTQKQWLDFVARENRQIEEAFCDPARDDCSIIALESEVYFDRMEMQERNSCTSCKIRRLSTLSSCDQSRTYCDEFSTRWMWYWQESDNKWNSFDVQQKKGSPKVCVTAPAIETQYLQTPRGKIRFHTSDHKYTLDFRTMTQKNLDPRYGTERKVKRRPARISVVKRSSNLQICPTPKYWEPTGAEQTGFQLVEVTKGSDEYLEVAGAFNKTMDTFRIQSIQRVQNVELWDRYCRQKMWMEEKLLHSNTVNERRLFHGTKDEHIDAICQQGFDPRVSGSSSGTVYGQGSYFAEDASYSNRYSTGNKMFFCKVLVGEFTTGDSKFKRPPEKPSSSSELFDSCVNIIDNPSIFVVFTREQAYPGWLVKYSART